MLLTKCYSGDKIKNNEMGGAYGTYGRHEWCILGLVGNLKELNHLDDVRVDGRMILKRILKEYDDRAWTGLIWLRSKIISGLQ